jgi:hypothetical protein
MEYDSIYAKFSIEPSDFERWLKSPAPAITDFDDWSRMNGNWDESWLQDRPEFRALTAGEMLDAWKDDAFNQSPLLTSYDPGSGEFILFQLLYDENMLNIADGIARLRGVQSYCKTNSHGYILVAPLLWDEGVTALLEFSLGSSNFIETDMVPPDLVKEANSFMAEQLRLLPND